jgi:hypothetical protein
MARAITPSQHLSKTLFLGIIALIMGIVPLTVGLRLWLVREEIVIHSTGTLSRNLLIGPRHIAHVFFTNIQPADFHIRTSRGTKTGTHHKVAFQTSDKAPEIRLLSLQSLADASLWKHRITTFLTARQPRPIV